MRHRIALFAMVCMYGIAAARGVRAQATADASAPAAPSAEPELTPPSTFALGAQLAADGTFTEPALAPQLGLILHVRLPDALSLRIVPSLAYVPVESALASLGPNASSDAHRVMTELRVALGYAFTDWLEGRIFVGLRTLHLYIPRLEIEMGIYGPSGYVEPAYWVHHLAMVSGIESTLRPLPSLGFEITASVGLGPLGLVHYGIPDGSPRFDIYATHVHAALALGWIFDV